MRITYMLWYLDDRTWHLLAEGSDHAQLLRGVEPKIKFEHRGYEYMICTTPYEIDGSVVDANKIFCVTTQKGW